MPPNWDQIEALWATRLAQKLIREGLGLELRLVPASPTKEEEQGPRPQLPNSAIRSLGQRLRHTRGEPPVKITSFGQGVGVALAPVYEANQRLGFVVVEGFSTEEESNDLVNLDAESVGWLRRLLLIVAQEASDFCNANRANQVGPRKRSELRVQYAELLGKSAAMQQIYTLLERVAGSESTILVHGENGTGKELVAKAIHRESPRAERPFVPQNCAAFNDNLLDSELFGHKRGAFTGATGDRAGLFDRAHQGTVFLDEIGDTSPALQVKLLRVLQEGAFLPVGGTEEHRVDVRVIAASNRDLEQMVREERFRQDLYYRLHVITIELPALRQRLEDIPMLVDHFLRRFARGRVVGRKKLTAEALDRLLAYSWPGNVRELENEIERLVVMAGDQRVIGPELLSARIRHPARWQLRPGSHDTENLPAAIEVLERSMIEDALRRSGGNKTQAAKVLGVSRRNLIRKVQLYQGKGEA